MRAGRSVTIFTGRISRKKYHEAKEIWIILKTTAKGLRPSAGDGKSGWVERKISISEINARRIAAVAGFLAVALGAFGAHGLKDLLGHNGTTAIWEKAVFYHFIHTVMLFVVAQIKPFRAMVWWCFLMGIILFSGSLYLLAVTNILWLGAITPLGGLSFLLGWALLVFNSKTES
jgi:uncharacterized membrane protein YgdD (TMEM256/DUF423 family)